MADRVRNVKYCYLKVSARAGQGAAVLEALRRVARKQAWRLSATKKVFLVQGADQLGACHRQLRKLADRKIRVTAAQGVAAGGSRYGMICWVRPKDHAKAARVLRAR